jgi:hypothetical protein
LTLGDVPITTPRCRLLASAVPNIDVDRGKDHLRLAEIPRVDERHAFLVEPVLLSEFSQRIRRKIPSVNTALRKSITLSISRDDFQTDEEKAEALKAQKPSDFESLYEQRKEENARLQAILTAGRVSRPTAPQSVKATVLAEQVKARLGPATFHQMTRNEKLQAVGVDPKSITNEGLSKIFGRGNDGTVGRDLMRTSPQRYAQLRQASLILNLFAA